jgi:hypothetical protein
MEREERERHDVENGDVPCLRKTTATLRVRSVIPCGSLDPRLWLRRMTMIRLRSATVAMTWLLPPSLRRCHISGRVPRQLQAQHLEVRRSL